MSVTISGTAGISTPPVVVQGSTSGGITLAAPAVAGTNTQTLVAATGTLAPLIAGTAVASTSGTSIDFTGIPSWVKRITVMFQGVSTSGTTDWGIRLGTSSGIESTGYLGATSNSSPSTTNATTLAQVVYSLSAATVSHGSLTITNLGSNLWIVSGSSGRSSTANTDTCGYSKTTVSTLDRVRITTVNGIDTFDAGSINIMYE